MKFILIFIFFLVTRLSYGLNSSTHFKFDYFSNLKTDIPDDGNQASGMSMKAVLDVYFENKDGIAIFKLSDLLTVSYNEDVGCNPETEFPDDRFEPPEDKEFLNAFQQPFRVNLRGSKPFSIEYEETEHRWLSNVRKGIASIFKNEILKGNFETQEEKDSISSLFHKGHLVNTFKVEEESIFGICESDYEIHEIKDSSFKIGNEFLPTQNSDSKGAFWRALRSVNFDKCKEKVTLNVHTVNENVNKDEKPRFTRSSVSSFVLRGSPGNFELYRADVEGVTTFPLSTFDDHEARATVKQKLVLINQTTNEELPTLGPNLRQSTTWMYQFWSTFKAPKDSKPLPWIIYSDENSFIDSDEVHGSKPFNTNHTSKIKDKILEIIERSSKLLTDMNQKANESQWQSIHDSLYMVGYYFKLLTKEDIVKIFDHIFQKKGKFERMLVIDTAAASGSHNAFEAILDYISKGKLEPFEIRNVFTALSIADGTINIARIMDYVLEVKFRYSSDSRGPPAVYLNFAHYLSEFCIHKAHNYNPIKEPFSEDCAHITQRFITHLKGIIYNETLKWERTFAIRVLDQLRTYVSFDILTPIIEGRMKSSSELKAMALRALRNWAPNRDRKQSVFRKPVMDLLRDVYSNNNQDFQVRAAALLSYVSWQPSTSFWYNLAKSTWNERSVDYSSFTSYLIKLYAEEKVPALEKQWKDASSALKFAKAPSIHRESIINSLLNILFKNYAKIYTLSRSLRDKAYIPSFIFEILTKENGLSLFKFENDIMFEGDISYIQYTNYDHIPYPNQFFETFSKEINLLYKPPSRYRESQMFFDILSGAPSNNISPEREMNSFRDGNLFYGGRFMKIFDKYDLFPNELGLFIFIFSGMPVAFGVTQKFQHLSSQFLLRVSAGYSRGIGVFLPWNQESHCASVDSALEFTLPVGDSQNSFNFSYEKKFPVFKISNTPMTLTFNSYLTNKENLVSSFQEVKKFNVQEKVLSEVDPFTGIKYDLVMKADSKIPFGLQDFLRFPRIPFKAWNFELHLNPEESQTKKLLFFLSMGPFSSSKVVEKGLESGKENPTISYWDTIDERAEKLTSAFGGSVEYIALKFNLTGEKERGHEIFYAASLEKESSAKMVGFTRTQIPGRSTQPASFCFDLRQKLPSTVEKDAAFIFQKKITKEANLKFLFNCSQPILNVHASYYMSDERKQETNRNCISKYDHIVLSPDLRLFYDTIDFNVSFIQDVESFDFVVTKEVLNSIQNFVDFPSIKKFTQETKDGNLQLKIQRNAYNKDWDLHLETSSEEALLATFSDTSLFHILSGISESLPLNPLQDIRYFYTAAKCTLQENSVTTFNGVHFSYHPSTCWTLASHLPFPHDPSSENIFLIRAAKVPSSIPDFKYIINRLKLEIEFSSNELKVNGTVVDRISDDSPDLKTIEKDVIYKIGQSYLIYDSVSRKGASVIVSPDKIEIYKEYLGRENGICGNSDLKTYPEYVGPKRCVYDDAQMFVASWTGKSDTCDAATLDEYRKEVNVFQANCETYQNRPLDVHLNQRCLYSGYKILTSNKNKYCISEKPLPFCQSTCLTTKHENKKVTYKCWPIEMAPELLKTSIENKLEIVTQPIPADPFSYEHFSNEIATLCKQF